MNESINAVSALLTTTKDAVVLFYRPNCPFCEYIMPLFDELINQYKDKLALQKIDLNKSGFDYKSEYNFNTVPTVMYFKDGEPKFQHGSENKGVTFDDMKQHIKDVYGL